VAATVNVNGRITDARDAVISIFDHGFLYGEGIYETMRTYNGRLFLWDRHMVRLRRSAGLIDLTLPFTGDELAAAVRDTQKAAALPGEAYIRILVTRGVGELTYDPKATPTPSVIIIVKPHVEPPAAAYDEGVRVVIVDIVRNHPSSVNPMIKSNNLMNSALAMQQALRQNAFEGIMRNYRGDLSELTMSNLWVVKDGMALTPPLESGLLPGIRREYLLEMAPEIGIAAREQVLRDEDLFAADEAFLSSSIKEIVPIVRVDDRAIGAGTPGPITRRLLDEFRRRAYAA
jgi:branched-chain amino acid aminotransferase